MTLISIRGWRPIRSRQTTSH